MADLFIPSKYDSITLDFRQSQDLGQHSIRLDFRHNLESTVQYQTEFRTRSFILQHWTQHREMQVILSEVSL